MIKASLGFRVLSGLLKTIGVLLIAAGFVGLSDSDKGASIGIIICGILFILSGILIIKGNIRMQQRIIEQKEIVEKEKEEEQERANLARKLQNERNQEYARKKREQAQKILDTYPDFSQEIKDKQPALNMPLDLLIYLLGEPDMQKKKPLLRKKKLQLIMEHIKPAQVHRSIGFRLLLKMDSSLG